MHAHVIESMARPQPGLLLLTLRPRTSTDTLHFKAGQYAALSFERNGRRSPVRCFSMTSPPNDAGKTLQFAMRIEGRFTRAMAMLRPGAVVYVQGPFGDFTLPASEQPVVFLAGGIGITPFVSMLRSLAETRSNTKVMLLYSGRLAGNVPLYEEISEVMQKLPHAHMQLFLTRSSKRSPTIQGAVQGRIGDEHFDRMATRAFQDSIYFVCGPPVFIKAMRRILRARGVSHSRIIVESFTQAPAIVLRGSVSLTEVVYGLTALAFLVIFLIIAVAGVY